MGLLYIITGGSGSGKSAYAEGLAGETADRLGAGRRFYLATMRPWDGECETRIRRHRQMRQGKGFETVEHYGRLSQLPPFPADSLVLLECLTNLLSNLFYDPSIRREELADLVTEDVLRLKRQVRALVVVTNEIFSDGVVYDPETERFRQMAGRVHTRLGAEADRVTEVVYGVAVPVLERENREGGRGRG